MKKILIVLFLCINSFVFASPEATHDELRLFRTELMEAFNQKDVNKLLSLLHKDIIINWLNGEVSIGPQSVKNYYDKMMTGPSKIVDSLNINPIPTSLATLYNNDNTAIVYGTSHDTYKLTSGLNFEIDTKWSAVLVKEDGKWLLINYHASVNLFDNPMLNKAKQMTYIFAAIGLIIGFIIGVIIFKRKKIAAA